MIVLNLPHKTNKNKQNNQTFLCWNFLGEMVINIEDINDNAPEFISSDSVFGE